MRPEQLDQTLKGSLYFVQQKDNCVKLVNNDNPDAKIGVETKDGPRFWLKHNVTITNPTASSKAELTEMLGDKGRIYIVKYNELTDVEKAKNIKYPTYNKTDILQYNVNSGVQEVPEGYEPEGCPQPA